jgi:aryl-alcohol dehydrogenase-like predicted oxidoreductase
MLPAGTDIKEFALRFALSHPAVSSAIVGFSEPCHVDDALEAEKAGAIPNEVLSQLRPFSYR